MACGTPVITDGETRFMVESLEGTAVAVDRVGDLDPPAIRARVEERFSAEAMAAGYERVYQEYLPVTTERASSFTPKEPHTLRALAPDRLG